MPCVPNRRAFDIGVDESSSWRSSGPPSAGRWKGPPGRGRLEGGATFLVGFWCTSATRSSLCKWGNAVGESAANLCGATLRAIIRAATAWLVLGRDTSTRSGDMKRLLIARGVLRFCRRIADSRRSYRTGGRRRVHSDSRKTAYSGREGGPATASRAAHRVFPRGWARRVGAGTSTPVTGIWGNPLAGARWASATGPGWPCLGGPTGIRAARAAGYGRAADHPSTCAPISPRW